MTETTILQSRIAGLQDGGTTISGVAIGAGDRTNGLEDTEKVWPAEELRAAADSLEGEPINVLHSEQVVGEVTAAGWDADREAVVYEAEITDEKLAAQAKEGRLDVSIEGRHRDGGTDDEGAMIASDIEFTGLSVVQMGAAPSNTAEPGSAEALAAELSAADVRAALATDDPVSPESGPGEDASGSDSSTTTTTTASMSDEPNDGGDNTPSREALLQQRNELKEDLRETEAELADLKEEHSALKDEVEDAKRVYAGILADHDSVFDEDDLVDRFAVAELRARVDDLDTSPEEAASPEPTVQSGGGSESADLSADAKAVLADLDADTRDEAEALLRNRLAKYDRRGWDANADQTRKQLAKLGVEVN